jgi:hypothetical protein
MREINIKFEHIYLKGQYFFNILKKTHLKKREKHFFAYLALILTLIS